MKYYCEVEVRTTGDKISFCFDHEGSIFTAFQKAEEIIKIENWKPDFSKRIEIEEFGNSG